jgi:long-subunit acyl-CoA synthetase (AMP-forming)
MTSLNKKLLKKITAAMAVVALLTPTAFVSSAAAETLPPIVVTAPRLYDSVSQAAWNAMQDAIMMAQMAADAAWLAQQQIINNPIPQSNWEGVIEAKNDEVVTDEVTAARVAAQNGIGAGRWFSFCQPGLCVKWYVNSPTKTTECSQTGGLCK